MIVDDDEGREKEEDEAHINKRRRQAGKDQGVPAVKGERKEEPQKKKGEDEQGVRIEKLEGKMENLQTSIKGMEAMMMQMMATMAGKKQEGGNDE